MTKTKTIHKRIISLLAAMVLCFVFCMPAFAAEDDTAIQPRFPGYAGLYSGLPRSIILIIIQSIIPGLAAIKSWM